jgi:phosphopantetheine adenylyltransferase
MKNLAEVKTLTIYKNVLLSDQEYQILKEEFPNDYENRIEDVSCYIESTGKKYKNFLATIRNWARRDEHKTYRNTKKQPDYTVQEGETI